MCVCLSQLPEIGMFGLVEVELFLLNTKLQVCLMYIQILMSNQTARTMATSHLDTNLTVNLIVNTKHVSLLHRTMFLLPHRLSSGMSDIIQKLIYFPTLLLILYAFVFLITKHIHVCLSVTTSWNCNLWASNWPEISFLVFKMWNFSLKRDGQSVTFSVEFNTTAVLEMHSNIYYLPNCLHLGNITNAHQCDW
jgi:hypothetical protein